MTAAHTAAGRRIRARVEGTVQGVGFRPHVFRLAQALGLHGFVYNIASRVELEVQGDGTAIDEFLRRLTADAPPLAAVDRVISEEMPAGGPAGFTILPSRRGSDVDARVSADVATCDDCLRELFDPADRRFGYGFINCTNCGPRFTIVLGVPYDRGRTTMASFVMCDACQREYDDPADRRFHAQPNACPACGPRLALLDAAGRAANIPGRGDPIMQAVQRLSQGAIIAVKGLGGFHLACLASDAAAVSTLRARKHRERKPFAVMVRDLAQARALVHLDAEAERALTSRQRPIVLAPRREDAVTAADVAPGVAELGVMLPYTPVHHLLLAGVGAPLVMTSGNRSDEPIVFRDAEAVPHLGAIADGFLVHDRAIETRTDDSVIRPPVTLRRSRGYVPTVLRLPMPVAPLLACGAELKHTFCMARDERAWLSHHIGDLTNYETWRSFTAGVEHFEALLEFVPRVIVHDLHPDYRSTRYALERPGEHVAIQHHHAHFAACLAEHGVSGPAVGLIFDGSGYGLDGSAWGGEVLTGDIAESSRAGHLRTVAMPGGDRAVEQPWRMACAWLAEIDGAVPALPDRLRDRVDLRRWRAVSELARSGVASPRTSSVGRLFDAVSALAGVVAVAMYEGQAAVELEALIDRAEAGAYPVPLAVEDDEGIVLDPRELIDRVRHDAAGGVASGVIAARFHRGLATASARAAIQAASRTGTRMVVLNGGVFQNRTLLTEARRQLAAGGMTVLVAERVPPNDGGIAYGQAAAAGARLACSARADRTSIGADVAAWPGEASPARIPSSGQREERTTCEATSSRTGHAPKATGSGIPATPPKDTRSNRPTSTNSRTKRRGPMS